MRGSLIINDVKSKHNVKYYGAVGDGVNDDTECIRNALNETSILYLDEGTYLISSTIFVRKQNIKIIGFNATLKRNGPFHIIEISTGGTCNIENVIFDGNKSIVSSKASCVFVRGSFNNFKNCVFENSSDHGIGFDGQNSILSRFNTVDGCLIRNNDGIGISNNLSSENRFTNNTIINNGLEGITLDNYCHYSIVKANTLLMNCRVGGVGSIGIDGTRYSIISDNIIRDTASERPGITTQNNISECVNNVISGNIITGVDTHSGTNYGIELHSFYPNSNKESVHNLIDTNIVQYGISGDGLNIMGTNIQTRLPVIVEYYNLESIYGTNDFDTMEVSNSLSFNSLNISLGIPNGFFGVRLVTMYYLYGDRIWINVTSLLTTNIRFKVDDGSYFDNDQTSMAKPSGYRRVSIELLYNSTRTGNTFETSDTITVSINGSSDIDNLLKRPSS